MLDLVAKQEELKNAEMAYQHLMAELQKATDDQEKLKNKIEQYRIKLERAK